MQDAEVEDFVQKEVRGKADSRVWTEEEKKLARKGSDILVEARWAHLDQIAAISDNCEFETTSNL